jgi:hypothetical protein
MGRGVSFALLPFLLGDVSSLMIEVVTGSGDAAETIGCYRND